jgi:hypothetical protein
MGDTVAEEMLLDKIPDDWREALRAIAHRSRAAFLRHPWLLPTLQERPRVSPNLMRHIEQSAQSISSLGERGAGIVFAVDDYTIGFALRELAAGARDDPTKGIAKRFREEAQEPYIRYLLESGEFPMLSQFLTLDHEPPRNSFDDGLDWLLDGFAKRLEI